MNTLSSVVVVLALAAGCRSSDKPASSPPSKNGSASANSTAWLQRLPSATSGSKLSLHRAAGLVAIHADGSIHVAKPPSAPAADAARPADPFAQVRPVLLAELTKALELPAVAPRTQGVVTGLEGTDEAGSASSAGSAGSAGSAALTIDPLARLGHPLPASGAPALPARTTTAFGIVHEHDVSAGVIVFADASAPAGVLVDVLAQTGGFLAVRQADGGLAALPLALDRQAPGPIAPTMSWVEIRLGRAIEVESVPGAPVAVATLDKLGEALAAAPTPAADLLVAADTKVQEVIDAIGQARAAKVEALGFGRTFEAGGPEAQARGPKSARVIAWSFVTRVAQDGDAAPLRDALATTLEPIRTCYTAALTKTATLAGTAVVELEITKGAGARATVTGVPPALATCVTTAVKAATFPQAGAAIAKISFAPR